jgi:F0F1-type ATP synthase membrane subunit b/b'
MQTADVRKKSMSFFTHARDTIKTKTWAKVTLVLVVAIIMLLMMIFGSTGMRVGVPIAAVLGMIVGYFILPSVFHPSEHDGSLAFNDDHIGKKVTRAEQSFEQANQQIAVAGERAEQILKRATEEAQKVQEAATAKAANLRDAAEKAQTERNLLRESAAQKLETQAEQLKAQVARLRTTTT